MNRINGFLNIDGYFIKKYKRKYVPELIKKVSDIHYIVTIDRENYYFKKTKNFYNELLAYEVATFLGLNAVPYDLAVFQNMYGVISKDFKKKNCNYISGQDLLFAYSRMPKSLNFLTNMGLEQTENNNFPNNAPYSYNINNLEVIWQAIEHRYKELNIYVDLEKIMNELVMYFIFNILVMQNDGASQNWVLEESENGVNLSPFFDNAEAFTIDDDKDLPVSNLSINFNDVGLGNYKILEEFLKVSEQAYINLFYDKFEMLTEDAFLQLIQRVENKIECSLPEDIKDKYIKMFHQNRENIESILNNLNKNRN